MGLNFVTGMRELEEEQKKAEAKAKGTGGNFLFLADGESSSFYFLHEPDESVGYYEHVFQDKGGWQYVPCSENCKLCDSNDDSKTRKSFRVAYLVMPTDEKKVLVLKTNTDLNATIINRFKRKGTMLATSHLLTRLGSGTDTKYDLDLDDGKPLPKNALKKLGVESATGYLQEILEGQIERYFDDGKGKGKGKSVSSKVDDIFEKEDDDEKPESLSRGEDVSAPTTESVTSDDDDDEEW